MENYSEYFEIFELFERKSTPEVVMQPQHKVKLNIKLHYFILYSVI